MSDNGTAVVTQETPLEKRNRLFRDFFEGAIEQVEASPDQAGKITEVLKGEISKRDELVDAISDVEVLTEALKQKEKQLADSRKQLEKSVYFLRENIRAQMVDLGLRRVDGFVHKIWIRDGDDSIEVENIELLPPEFITWSPVPDKNAIARALAEGKVVPGARLKKGEKILTIR